MNGILKKSKTLHAGILLIILIALYVSACLQVLSRLDETSLITHYISFPYSDTSPISFPIPRWVTDLYWDTYGHTKVLQANANTDKYISYISERVLLAVQLSQKLDSTRYQPLLTELVCVKRSNPMDMQLIQALQRKSQSKLLETVIQSCEEKNE